MNCQNQGSRNAIVLWGVIPCLLLASFIPVAAAFEPVEIPDPQLASVLRDVLDRKGIEAPVFDSDNLSRIYFLDATNRGIKDLTGLEFCDSLRELHLADNAIVSCQSLAGCTELRVLNVSGNGLVDIGPLKTLTELRWLNIAGNKIASLTGLSDLKLLATLLADDNKIDSIDPLKGLQHLHSLQLGRNEIVDISVLSSLPAIDTVNLSGNCISDITSLLSVTELKWAFLSNNRIEDLTPLSEMLDTEAVKTSLPLWRLHIDGNSLNEAASQVVNRLKTAGATVCTRTPFEISENQTSTDADRE